MQAEGSQVSGEQGHNGLAFRIAEAAVVFNYFWAVWSQHQAEVQKTPVRQPVFFQSGYRRSHDFLFNAFQHFRLHQPAGSHRSHAARVGACIAFLEAFVVPCRAEDEIMVVHQSAEDGNFRSGKKFFHQQPPFTKASVRKYFFQERVCFLLAHADGYALSGGQTVKFQHGRIVVSDELPGFLQCGRYARLPGRDAVAEQEVLGKFLAGFQLGAFFYRPPAGDARTGAGIGQAFILDQIAFLPGNAEIHFIGNHPVDQRGQIPGRDGGSQTVDGVTSRETVHFRSGGRFLECLDQCMFTSTFSNNGYFHTPPVCRDGLILPS